MSAYEGRMVRVWDRDGLYIVIEVLTPYQRVVLTTEEASETYNFLKEYFEEGDS